MLAAVFSFPSFPLSNVTDIASATRDLSARLVPKDENKSLVSKWLFLRFRRHFKCKVFVFLSVVKCMKNSGINVVTQAAKCPCC